jgi:glycerol kinase
MTADLVLAIDQGTTNTKALVVAADGSVVTRAARPMKVVYPQPGWAEQSATDLWATVHEAVAEALRDVDRGRLAAIAISNQRESVVLWDRATGAPIGPCVIWQCRRSSAACASLRARGLAEAIRAKTGLGLDPLFPASKIAWLLDQHPSLRPRAARGELAVGTIDAWLLWNLTGGRVHACDRSNASRTQLFDIRRLAWDAELAEIFRVPLAVLPEVRPSDARFGTTTTGLAGIPAGIPIRAMMGDSHAALYGHAVDGPGTVKATYGTGSSLMTLTDGVVASTHGLASTIAWSRGDRVAHALEGNISVSAQAAAFMAKMLGLADVVALSALAETVDGSDGVVFVPALVGLGAPHWNDAARGLVTGLSLGSTPAHIARATFEAIALQIVDVVEAMEGDLHHPLARLSVDGGATANRFLMRLQADLAGRPIDVSGITELSAVGAARMAFAAIGGDDTRLFVPEVTTFTPTLSPDRRAAIRATWKSAVARAQA